MAKSTHYIESIVPVLSKNKKIGMAFVIQKDDEYTYLLTCEHVVFNNDECKKELSLRDDECDSFNLPFDENNITRYNGIDLALIKVKGLKSKRTCLLQAQQYDANLIVSTFSNINDDKDSFIHENIEATLLQKTTLKVTPE